MDKYELTLSNMVVNKQKNMTGDEMDAIDEHDDKIKCQNDTKECVRNGDV